MKFGKTLDYSMMLTAPLRESLQGMGVPHNKLKNKLCLKYTKKYEAIIEFVTSIERGAKNKHVFYVRPLIAEAGRLDTDQ